jgi:NitT/TauT family transport system substrate-binding protein
VTPWRGLIALVALTLSPLPAFAQETVKIGIGFGLAFLPTYICEDLKLVEKAAKTLHVDVKASYQRLSSANAVRDALASGAIDMAPFGTAPLLAAWAQAKDKPRQILAVSGLTTLPLTLVSKQPNVASIADVSAADRIAMPSLTAPQMYLLEMQSEKTFNKFDHLRGQVVAMSPADAIAALVAGNSPVTAYFASPPFTELALHEAGVHQVLTSADVMNGKSSFLMLGAMRSYVEAHAPVTEAVGKAIDEAARVIHDDPRRAAQIYLTHEPSTTFSAAAIEAVLRGIGGEFGSAIYGVQVFADFMGRHNELKEPPQSWKEIAAPALLKSPSG